AARRRRGDLSQLRCVRHCARDAPGRLAPRSPSLPTLLGSTRVGSGGFRQCTTHYGRAFCSQKRPRLAARRYAAGTISHRRALASPDPHAIRSSLGWWGLATRGLVVADAAPHLSPSTRWAPTPAGTACGLRT